MSFNKRTQESSYKYSIPVDCTEALSDKVDPSIAEMFSGYKCPDSSMSIQGQGDQDQSSKAFYYVVNSCPSMNNIRTKLEIDTIECVDSYTEITAALQSFKAEVKVVNAFFDANTFLDNQQLSYA